MHPACSRVTNHREQPLVTAAVTEVRNICSSPFAELHDQLLRCLRQDLVLVRITASTEPESQELLVNVLRLLPGEDVDRQAGCSGVWVTPADELHSVCLYCVTYPT